MLLDTTQKEIQFKLTDIRKGNSKTSVCELGYPPHRENRENGPQKIPVRGKHKEFGNFVKTLGILFPQVVNSLMLKIKDIAIFAAKFPYFFQKLDRSAKSVLCM